VESLSSLVDEIWGAPSLPVRDRENGSISTKAEQVRDVDPIASEPDEDDEDELVPLGLVRREIELDLREQRLRQQERVDELERYIETQIDERMRQAFAEIFAGRVSREAPWHTLAWTQVETMHGGAFRVWTEETREWRTCLRARCKRGCRWCPRGPR